MARHQVTVVVFEATEMDDEDMPPTDLMEFAGWVSKLIGQVPVQHIATAKFSIGSASFYDDSYAKVRVSYERPETDAEVAAREQAEIARSIEREAEERALMGRLQARYGGGTLCTDPVKLAEAAAKHPADRPGGRRDPRK